MLHYLSCDAVVPAKGSELIQVLEACPSDSYVYCTKYASKNETAI